MPLHSQTSGRSGYPVSVAQGLTIVDRHGDRLIQVALYASLVVIYAWFGGMKFTAYEAEGLVPLV
ncbi:DUF417 family protein, partial [Methylobacterium sp. NPDC097158]